MAEENTQATQPTQPVANQATEVKEHNMTDYGAEIEPLSDTYWISGDGLDGKYHDCDGPYTAPRKIMTIWPRVTTKPNPNFKYQKYDYLKSEWVNMDSESQAQQMTDVVNSQKKLEDTVTQLTKNISDSQISSTSEKRELTKKLDDIQSSQKQFGQSVTQLTQMVSQFMITNTKSQEENGGNK